ncbi:MAG: nucleoside-diphosphate kinase [Bacilli bacterium]|nr:nucleoside-diphosphate kinase [Bacilli bacterium]
MERTYIMTKPDAYDRGLIGQIITRIENKGFKIVDMKMMNLDEDILKEHYAHLADKPFFPEIVEYMMSAPVIGMVVEGSGVVDSMRKIMGPTDGLEANPGTIRGDFANNKSQNLIHGSDSIENAEIEIKRFFG